MSATRPSSARAFYAFASLLASACFQTTAPEGWLSTPAVAQREAYGGWISAAYTLGAGTATVEGELIAASPDSLHVLTADSLVTVATSAVTSATLTTYDARLNTLNMWTILGAVSSLSHGVGLLLSVPMWIIVGTTATASASKAPRVQSVDAALLRPYARFPQGLPPGLERRALRQKEVPRT
jgi:hypothetical protein